MGNIKEGKRSPNKQEFTSRKSNCNECNHAEAGTSAPLIYTNDFLSLIANKKLTTISYGT
jgi:hypothetical protein